MSTNIEVQIGDIVRSLKKLERQVSDSGEKIVRLKMEQGCLLKDVVGSAKYGEGAVERIANESGIMESTLRIAYGHAKRFNFKTALLDKEIEKLKEAGKHISFNYFRAALKPEVNPDLHGGEEKHKNYLLSKVERAGTDLQTAADHYPHSKQVQGAAVAIAETIQEAEFKIFDPEKTAGTIIKGEAWRSPKYAAFVRKQPCCVSGATKGIEAHHPKYRSSGAQSSDFYLIPLAKEFHDEWHKLGTKKFIEKYGLRMDLIIQRQWEKFATENL